MEKEKVGEYIKYKGAKYIIDYIDNLYYGYIEIPEEQRATVFKKMEEDRMEGIGKINSYKITENYCKKFIDYYNII